MLAGPCPSNSDFGIGLLSKQPPMVGFKAHSRASADTALVEAVAVATANSFEKASRAQISKDCLAMSYTVT